METSEDGTSEMNSLFPFSSSKGRNRRDGERGVAWEEQARNSTGRYHNRTKMNAEVLRRPATTYYVRKWRESTVNMDPLGMIGIYIFSSFVVDAARIILNSDK